MYYDNLLKLCGYEKKMIENERPRIERTFEKLEFTDDDISRAEERVRYYFDTELQSVRKMLGLWIQSLIDLVLSKEEGKKVVYTCMPPFFHVLNGLAALSSDLYVTSPDFTLAQTVGGIFGKLVPFLKAAEEDILPAGSAFCGPIQAKYGAIIKGAIPVPDLFVSSGFVCDQSPKVDELLGTKYNIPIVYSDGPNDADRMNWPNINNIRIQYIASEYKYVLKQIETILGYHVTEEIAQKAELRVRKITVLCNQIFDIIRKSDPVPTGFINFAGVARLAKLGINSTTISRDMEGLVNLHLTELQERVTKGKGTIAKGAPRVGIVTFSSIPEPIKMIENSGLTVLIDISGLVTTKADLIDSGYETYWDRGAEALLRYCGLAFSKRLVQVFSEWNLDGAILNYPIGCRDICMEIHKASELLTKKLGIPVLFFENDYCDPRICISESIINRVAAFAEMLRLKKETKIK